MEKSIKVHLVNESGEAVADYIIKRLNVKSAIRRQKMFSLIKEDDETIRGQIFSCAAIACTLCDDKGELIYPEDKYPELSAVDELFDMDYEVYNAIGLAYLEINPVQPTLAAKKKKS